MSDSDTLIPDANPAVRTDRLLDRYTRPSPASRDRLEAEFDTEIGRAHV